MYTVDDIPPYDVVRTEPGYRPKNLVIALNTQEQYDFLFNLLGNAIDSPTLRRKDKGFLLEIRGSLLRGN